MVYKKLAFNFFSIFSSGGYFVYRSETILAILVGSHIGNIPEKFESHWPKGLGEDSIKSKLFKFFLFLAFATILFIGAKPFYLF